MSVRCASELGCCSKTVEIREPTPELFEALVDQIRRDNDLRIEKKKPDTRPHLRRVSSSVKIAVGEVEAEKVLKAAFLAQAERIEMMVKREEDERPRPR